MTKSYPYIGDKKLFAAVMDVCDAVHLGFPFDEAVESTLWRFPVRRDALERHASERLRVEAGTLKKAWFPCAEIIRCGELATVGRIEGAFVYGPEDVPIRFKKADDERTQKAKDRATGEFFVSYTHECVLNESFKTKEEAVLAGERDLDEITERYETCGGT